MPAESELTGARVFSDVVKYCASKTDDTHGISLLVISAQPDDASDTPSTSARDGADCADQEPAVNFVDIEIPGPPEGVIYPTLAYKNGINNGKRSPFRPLKSRRREWKDALTRSLLPEPVRNTCCGLFAGRIRYLVLLISMLCMTATRSNELSFNFTVICMTSNSSVNNDTPVMMRPDETSMVFSGAGFGAIIFVLPVAYALHYLGSRVTFAFVLLCSALATICLSPLARVGPMWMVPARLLQGLALAAVMPLMGKISAEWSPLAEIGKFMTLLSVAGQLSQIITMPVAAQLCVHSGWSSVYYAHGAVAALLALAFLAFYRSAPSQHPCVGQDELLYITKGVTEQSKRERKVPYSAILSSRPVIAVLIAFAGISIGFQTINQFMPTFLNKVLGMPITKTGMSAVVPPLTQLFVKLLAGWSSDKITRIPERLKIQIFNSIAMCGCGVFLLPLGFLTPDNSFVALLCFTASISCLGMVACGSMKSATLVARSFTHFVMAVVQLVVCMGMLLVPFLVGQLAPDNTISQWRLVFFAVFCVLLLTNIAFCLLCSAEAEPWACTTSAVRMTELERLREAEIVEKIAPVEA